jgi:hypothetical protein
MTDAVPVMPVPAEISGRRVLQTGLLGPLPVPDGRGDPGELEALSRRAALYATRARGDGIGRAYRANWRHFSAWCDRHMVSKCTQDSSQSTYDPTNFFHMNQNIGIA